MTNTFTAEQFATTSKANIKALETLTGNAFGGMEKLLELNLAASKAMMSDSFGSIKAILGAKDPQEAMALHTAMFQPLAEKSVAYSRHVIAITTESGAEFAKAFEAKMAETQDGFGSLVDSLAKNGLQTVHQSPDEFARLLRQDFQRWQVIAKATGFTAED